MRKIVKKILTDKTVRNKAKLNSILLSENAPMVAWGL